MRHMRFLVLTGHLDEFALPDLIKTLHAQSKSGRLQVEYTESPGMFYFEKGRLVDAQLGALRGLEALYLSLSLPGAPFNFNPLIKPPERTFGEREQRHVEELLEGTPAGRADIAIPASSAVTSLKVAHPASITRPAQPAGSGLALSAPEEEHVLARLSQVESALSSYSKRFSRERAVYAAVIAFLILAALVPQLLSRTSTETSAPPGVASAAPSEPAGAARVRPYTEAGQPSAGGPGHEAGGHDAASEGRPSDAADRAPAQPAAVNTKLRKETVPATQSVERGRSSARQEKPAVGVHVVQVVMMVEQGRVIQAKVRNPRAGMSGYEALALRMARQRRYPDDFSGPDTLQLKVKP